MRRWIELGKNLLIAGLLCTAVLLTLYIIKPGPFLELYGVSAVAALFNSDNRQTEYPLQQSVVTEAAKPWAISVQTGNGRLTGQYDTAVTDALYDSLGRYLGEALGTAQTMETMTQAQLELLLDQTGVYMAFSGSVPLSALADWLGTELTPDAQALAEETATIQALVLAVEEDTVTLGCVSAAGYGRCATQVSAQALSAALEGYGADGSMFAFEGTDRYTQLTRLDPLCLIGAAAPAVSAVSVAAQLNVDDTAVVLGFNPYGGTGYTSATGARVFSEAGSQLQIADAQVKYTSSAGRFTADSVSPTDRIETARALLAALWETGLGDARLYLSDYRETETGAVLEFTYMVGGIPVELSQPAATVVFSGAALSQLTFQARTYTIQEDQSLPVMPALQASALLESGQSLTLRYAETGMDALSCGWKAG